jgi:DNA polymerase-3 subunit epsilon
VLTFPALPSRYDDLATPLSQVTFVVLDLETTGTSPSLDAITEIGAVKYRGGEHLGTFATLVNPGVPIPPFITVLTGITEAMVLPAPRIEELLAPLLEFIGNAVLVGHNFRFDTSFLDAALIRRGFRPLENPRVDTLGMSRRLLRDEVPDLKLGTLAQHLRVATEPCHRALDDADATAEVFHALLERAGTLGVLGLDDLLAVPRLRSHPTSRKLRLTARLPRSPGIYRFRDRAGRVIYVGRATNLRARVRAHFHGDTRSTIPQLVRETETMEWTECSEELEVSVRETRLLREHQPRFNRGAEGWRKYAYLKLTLTERLPRLAVVREPREDGARYIGPLPSSAVAAELRDAIEAAVPLRRCNTRIGRNVELDCSTPCSTPPAADRGPCPGHPADDDYRHLVDTVERGLAGEPDALLHPLVRARDEHVDAERYEAAARTRDQIAALTRALREDLQLHWLRAAPTLRFGTPTGIIELHHGRLRIADDDAVDASPHAVIDRRAVDELLIVARWIEREVGAGRARLLDPTGPGALGPFTPDRAGRAGADSGLGGDVPLGDPTRPRRGRGSGW